MKSIAKSNKKSFLIIISVFILVLYIFTLSNKPIQEIHVDLNENSINHPYSKSLKLEISGSIVENPIFINGSATGLAAHNWTWAEEQDWCSGSGTLNDPYVIENLFIDGKNQSSCIEIHNSAKFLIIRECTIFNSNSSGINFENVHNSTISDNYCTYNTNGIVLWECRNNTISGNIANNNTEVGIFLLQCVNNTIYNNTANYNNGSLINSMGILLYICDFNIVSENTADNNKYGIFVSSNYPTIWGCHNNTIINNTVSYNDGGIKLYGMGRTYNNTIIGNCVSKNLEYGIELSKSPQNMISNNIIKDNEKDGIYLIFQSHNNTISDNIIENNNQQGIKIDFESHGNLLYYNCFVGNGINAQDNGTYNRWDNGIFGNYWDDYNGVDNDGNDIGDTPYDVPPVGSSVDNFPLMKCPFSIPQDSEGFPMELVIIISVISGGAVIGVATLLLIIRKMKRIK